MVGTPPDAFASGCFAYPTLVHSFGRVGKGAPSRRAHHSFRDARRWWARHRTRSRPAALPTLRWCTRLVGWAKARLRAVPTIFSGTREDGGHATGCFASGCFAHPTLVHSFRRVGKGAPSRRAHHFFPDARRWWARHRTRSRPAALPTLRWCTRLVGWAKARLRAVPTIFSGMREDGGHATGRVRVRLLCPPYAGALVW